MGVPSGRTGAPAQRIPLSPGPAAGMAASLWMGDVSERGGSGPRRRNPSVSSVGGCEGEASSNSQKVKVNGKQSSFG